MNRWQHTGAFVVQFCAEAEVVEERFQGRVEHIATNRGVRFDSWSELIRFFEEALAFGHAAGPTPELPVGTDDN